jgi:hypothetical protein
LHTDAEALVWAPKNQVPYKAFLPTTAFIHKTHVIENNFRNFHLSVQKAGKTTQSGLKIFQGFRFF